jgi:hypothetical protein
VRLSEYLKGKQRGEKARIARAAGVSWQTIRNAASDDAPAMRYETAVKVSEATGGAVSVRELCMPGAPPEEPATPPGEAA